MPDLAGKTVIVVDDGLATGASMRAAIQAVRQLGPARVVAAVPAAPESTCTELAGLVDEVVCATTPSPFFSVGEAYWDFTQTTDEEVRDLLRAAAPTAPAGVGARGPTDAGLIRAEAGRVEEGVPEGDALLKLIGESHLVLIGEGSHGTHRCSQRAGGSHVRCIAKIGGWRCRPFASANSPEAATRSLVVGRPQRRSHGRRVAARLRALSHLDVAQRRGARLRWVAA